MRGRESPEFFPGGGVDRKDLAMGGDAIKDAIHDDRIALHLPIGTGVINPRTFKPVDIPGIDLFGSEGIIPGAQTAAAIGNLGKKAWGTCDKYDSY